MRRGEFVTGMGGAAATVAWPSAVARVGAIVAAAGSLLWAQSTTAQDLCRPTLSLTAVNSVAGHWSGRIDVQSDVCATAHGFFYIKFVRLKENAPDVSFFEQFAWKKGQLTHIGLSLTQDEAVSEFELGLAGICPCRSSFVSGSLPIARQPEVTER